MRAAVALAVALLAVAGCGGSDSQSVWPKRVDRWWRHGRTPTATAS